MDDNKKMIPWYIWLLFAVLVVSQLAVGIYYSVINFDKDDIDDVSVADVPEITEDTLEVSRLKLLRDSLDNADHQDSEGGGSIEVSSESKLITDDKVEVKHLATGSASIHHTLSGYPMTTAEYTNKGLYFELTPTFETTSGNLTMTVTLGQFTRNFVPDVKNINQLTANSTNFVMAYMDIQNSVVYLSGKDGMVGTEVTDIPFESGAAVGISVTPDGLIEVHVGDGVYTYSETVGDNFVDFSISAPPVYLSLATQMTENTEHITYSWNAGQLPFVRPGSVDGRVNLLGQEI